MPRRDARMYLFDAAAAADRVERLTAGKTLADYQADENLRLIVERSFEIIGEALRQAVDASPASSRESQRSAGSSTFATF